MMIRLKNIKKAAAVLICSALTVGMVCTMTGCSGNQEEETTGILVSQEETQSPSDEITQAESEQESETQETTLQSESESETAAPIETETDADGYVVDDSTVYSIGDVNIRIAPSTESGQVVDVLRADYPLHRVGYTEQWSKIEIGGEIYYVSSEFLSTTRGDHESLQQQSESEVVSTLTPESTQGGSQQPPIPGEPVAGGNGYTTDTGAGTNGYAVCIDAGHQEHGMSDLEPNAPGSSEMKAMLTTGTQGVATGKAEYELNLEVSLLLKQELVRRGYRVIMIRETNTCPVSNAQRAVVANESGANVFVRIHANSSTDPAMNGALTMAPSTQNPYVANLAPDSIRLSQNIVDGLCTQTGARNIGVLATDTMTGINWCTIPVSIVEMGYMSNANEDVLMADTGYQSKLVAGIADGLDAYFGR